MTKIYTIKKLNIKYSIINIKQFTGTSVTQSMPLKEENK
jgi:hypothetical protein